MKKTIIFFVLVVIFCNISFSYAAYLEYKKHVLDTYYNAIGSRNYQTAYYLRSPEWRSNHSYEWFCDNWCNNAIIKLLSVKEVSDSDYVVKIRLYSEDSPPGTSIERYDGVLHKAYYSGKAYLSLQEENGRGEGYYIDDIQVTEE